MPSCGGPVYQPTTVSYEPRSGGGNGSGGGLGFLGPASSIGVDSPLRIFRKPKPQLALILFALISLAAGIAMLASGAADWIEDQEFVRQQQQQLPIEQTTDDEVSETQTEAVTPCVNIPLGILLGGVFMTCLGIVGMGLYLKVADWRRNCVCPCPCPFFDKKQSLARQLQCQNVDGGCGQGIMALNPSTDPLVSHTQYAPVSELPSLRADDEERRNLMPDNKDCLSSAEESDRMLEPDPRIVLRPVGRVEDA
ncbi:hypothetical protein FF38_09076 [Lucilia cuprina]|uniref:Uncharacterized protein n=1 Tax=Lucilia cuprina TaxID=7375 RepID=A0A0L0CN25_LUCCU|nr:hypothetical protein CVS40_6437 [Lucilia cuprina]KNC33743.1 hypothetical protein FF38_09076 [Lucilia cuprina]